MLGALLVAIVGSFERRHAALLNANELMLNRKVENIRSELIRRRNVYAPAISGLLAYSFEHGLLEVRTNPDNFGNGVKANFALRAELELFGSKNLLDKYDEAATAVMEGAAFAANVVLGEENQDRVTEDKLSSKQDQSMQLLVDAMRQDLEILESQIERLLSGKTQTPSQEI